MRLLNIRYKLYLWLKKALKKLSNRKNIFLALLTISTVLIIKQTLMHSSFKRTNRPYKPFFTAHSFVRLC